MVRLSKVHDPLFKHQWLLGRGHGHQGLQIVTRGVCYDHEPGISIRRTRGGNLKEYGTNGLVFKRQDDD